MKTLSILLLSFTISVGAFAQDANQLVKVVKAKLDKVNDYVAEGRMKTDVTFIKAPAGKVKVFYKKPNKFKVKRDGGISILPKGGVSINMNSVLTGDAFDVIPAGEMVLSGTKVKILKLLPRNESGDIVLTTLYVDEANALIRKTNTTTRDNGTYEMEMTYGKFAAYGLPDKVVFAFNTKDYKIPKGLTLDFESGETTKEDKLKGKKGRVEITYTNYTINKGVSDSEFK